MMILNVTIFMAKLSRVLKLGAFKDDTKDELLQRYRLRLTHGFESAVLDKVIRYVRDEKDVEGIRVRVELEPFMDHTVMHEDCEIDNVEDLCDKLAEISVMVLNMRRRRNL